MKLWNIETGKLWEGSPVDARELLARKGWTATEPVPVAPPEVEQVETVKPVEANFDLTPIDETPQQESEGEKPREKRKYTRSWDR